MASKNRSGKSFKAQYTGYQAMGSHIKNKIKKLYKHLAKQENDKQAEAALILAEKGSLRYTRNKNG